MQEYKYLFGSKMLKLNNPRDEDWLTFVDKRGSEIKETGYRSLPFYKIMIPRFIAGKNIRSDFYKATFMYQLSRGFFETDSDYLFKEFNILEHISVWKQYLIAYINDSKTEERAVSQSILPKQFYHLLYQYHMIKENTHWISDAARVDVQKIHDREMPSTYFYELKDKINSL